MATIFKYEVLPGLNTISIPQSSRILSAGAQNNSVFIWVLTTNNTQTEAKHVFVSGTGHPIENELAEQLNFINTVIVGEFVWHVFQRNA